MCSMHEVDRGVYYNRYVYYDMGMLAWHAAVQRYPRLAIGRLGGSRARRILDGLPTEMVASPCCREGVTVDATSLQSWPGIKKTEIWRTHTVFLSVS